MGTVLYMFFFGGGGAALVYGPLRCMAAQVFRPGVQKGQVFRPGARQAEVFTPGAQAGGTVR